MNAAPETSEIDSARPDSKGGGGSGSTGTAGRSPELRNPALGEDNVNGNRKRAGAEERRLHGANEETRSEDSSSTTT